jgi:hypothetical protein
MADEQQAQSPASPSTKTPVDEFMLSEHQVIASAHFDLHNGLRQSFRFYLGLIAVPLTVLAVLRDPNIDLFHLPNFMLGLFVAIPILGLLMFLSMVNTRFDIIFYTRTVNGVRDYFAMRAEQIGVPDFRRFLVLSTNKLFPSYYEFSRAYTWLFLLVALVNSAYVLICLRNFQNRGWFCWRAWEAMLSCLLLHVGPYFYWAKVRTDKDKSGATNAK